MDSQEPKELGYEKFICTECYEFGAHTNVTYGNWARHIIEFTFIFAIIIIPSLIYFSCIFLMFILARGRFVAIDTMNLFPLFQYLPQSPHSVKICPHCKRVDVQAKVGDANGQTALHFHKKNGMHLRDEKTQQPSQNEDQKKRVDPEEF